MSATPRARHLKPGNRDLAKVRRPPLHERIGNSASGVLGEELGTLVYSVLEGIKRRTIPATAGRLVLERLLPPDRPIRLDLPLIHSVGDLRDAQDRIITALNDGRITPSEASRLQEVAIRALRSCREAEPELSDARLVDPAERRRLICEMAEEFGMIWPKEGSE
jgi:hypothetical protein